MPRWTIGYDATVTIHVEAETEKEAIEKADKMTKQFWDLGEDEKELAIQQLYVVTNDDTGQTVLK